MSYPSGSTTTLRKIHPRILCIRTLSHPCFLLASSLFLFYFSLELCQCLLPNYLIHVHVSPRLSFRFCPTYLLVPLLSCCSFTHGSIAIPCFVVFSLPSCLRIAPPCTCIVVEKKGEVTWVGTTSNSLLDPLLSKPLTCNCATK